ncbi:MAG TPA: hypothetical protein VMW49_07730 [Candidatus Dormibacteraeota bacterium]|nr:hypothetical protein [Candidatus Dormibacteraeota bacterium]
MTPTPAAPATARRLPRRIAELVAGLSLTVVLGIVAAACGGPSTPAGAAAKPPTVHLYTTILTGSIVGPSDGPAFSPADMVVPKGSTVILTIYNYDDGAAPLPATSPYTKVTGGTETVNGTPVTSVPDATISHTFTVTALGLNVPIPASPAAPAPNGDRQPAVVTFTFHATKAGTFTWACLAPCGTGSNGMGGPMVAAGYMKGSLQVA